jgi:PEP-CTERM motif
VSRKPLQVLMCAALAAALGMFGTAARATFYAGDFDPPPEPGHFVGSFLLDIQDGCNTDGCTINLVSLSITSGTSINGFFMFTGHQDDIALSGASFNPSLNFTSDLIALTGVSSPGFSRGVGVNAVGGCEAALKFTSTNGNDPDHPGFVADVGALCGDQFIPMGTATYTAVAVPEPATLALILGGLGAGWLQRRRKSAA